MKNNDLIIILTFFIFTSILILITFNFIKYKTTPDSNNSENTLLTQENNFFGAPAKVDNIDSIKIEPYGCFVNLKNQFFKETVNPYSKDQNQISSSYYFTESEKTKSLRRLILDVIKNGYTTFGNKMLQKYDNEGGTKNISLLEMGKLGKLAGYNYMSVLRSPSDAEGTIYKAYFTYSPPTISSALYRFNSNYTNKDFESILTDSDLPNHTLTPKLNNHISQISEDPSDQKELACGFPCITYGEPETFVDTQGVVRQYMCGSVNYPTLKTPEHYAVYKLIGV